MIRRAMLLDYAMLALLIAAFADAIRYASRDDYFDTLPPYAAATCRHYAMMPLF